MKLTQEQKDYFDYLLEMLVKSTMRAFYSKDGQFAFAIAPAYSYIKNPKVFRVFTTLCNPADQFKKKLGLIELSNKIDNGEFILIRAENQQDAIFRIMDMMGAEFEYNEYN